MSSTLMKIDHDVGSVAGQIGGAGFLWLDPGRLGRRGDPISGSAGVELAY
jgi:hypothetical protein